MNSTPITIAGNLTGEPELRFTPGGKASVRMRMAVNSRYQDITGAWVEGATSWHSVVAWGPFAEYIANSLTKGERVVVHGRLEQREYATEAGERRTAWEITADEVGLSLRHAGARREAAPPRVATAA